MTDKRKNDIFDGSWEPEQSGIPGAEPTYNIPIPKKWPVQTFYQLVPFKGQHAQRIVYVWLN